jgi:hypothetical protein
VESGEDTARFRQRRLPPPTDFVLIAVKKKYESFFVS